MKVRITTRGPRAGPGERRGEVGSFEPYGSAQFVGPLRLPPGVGPNLHSITPRRRRAAGPRGLVRWDPPTSFLARRRHRSPDVPGPHAPPTTRVWRPGPSASSAAGFVRTSLHASVRPYVSRRSRYACPHPDGKGGRWFRRRRGRVRGRTDVTGRPPRHGGPSLGITASSRIRGIRR